MLKVLLVDDDLDFCDAAAQLITLMGHDVTVSNSLSEAHTALKHTRFSNILLDFMLPDGSGLHLIDHFKDDPDAPHITLITGHPSVKNIMAGLCGPKVNYLIKPINKADLEAAIKTNVASTVAKSDRHFGCLVGESAPMQELYTMIDRVARTPANVMLMGESGVGKEVVAQAIHNASNASRGAQSKLVAANCGAFSRELIGSELFGHEKGAFTGAVARKIGFFEQAEGGSLFLDEVTEMPIDMQPNLLRVLETNKVTRVGGVKEIDIDCRVISATNRTTEDLAENNVLREDLYFRLAVFPIHIPPLRKRKEDIPLLAEHFLADLNEQNGCAYQFTPAQIEKLTQYDWPGNVRELRHAIHRAFIMSDPAGTEVALPSDFSSPFTKVKKAEPGISAGVKIDEMEKELITTTLEHLDGDKPQAAEMLGISLKTLYNRLNKYGELTSE